MVQQQVIHSYPGKKEKSSNMSRELTPITSLESMRRRYNSVRSRPVAAKQTGQMPDVVTAV